MATLNGSDSPGLIQRKTEVAVWLLALARDIVPAGPLVGIEIGVKQGHLAAAMLRLDASLHLTLVDRWASAAPESDYARLGDPAAMASTETHNEWLQQTYEIVAFAHDRVTIIRSDSVIAGQSFQGPQAHIIFIDADHSYEGRLADLRAWYSHIVDGGIIAGGLWRTAFGGNCSARAVQDFCEQQRITNEIWHGPLRTWAFQKPKAI